MNATKYCTCILLLAIGTAARAQDPGFEISASIGSAQHARNVQLGTPFTPLLTGESEHRDLAYSLTAAYRFNPHFGLELGLLNLGEIEASVTDASGMTDARANLEFTTHGVTLAAIASLPLGKWTPYLKVGGIYSKTKLHFLGSVDGDTFAATIDGDDLDALFGLGVKYDLNERWQVRLEGTFVADAGHASTGTSNYFAGLLGLTWRF